MRRSLQFENSFATVALSEVSILIESPETVSTDFVQEINCITATKRKALSGHWNFFMFKVFALLVLRRYNIYFDTSVKYRKHDTLCLHLYGALRYKRMARLIQSNSVTFYNTKQKPFGFTNRS